MNTTEQIMALADKYQATAPNVNGYRQQLQSAIEALVQERDEFKTRMQRLMTTQFATSKERDALKELLKDERNRGLQLLADAKEWQQGFMREEAANKALRDALEGVMPWVVTQEVACHGMKCREPVCQSCNSDSEEAAEYACAAYQIASAALSKEK